MKKTLFASVVIFFVLGMSGSANTDQVEILTASATSSSPDSSPVGCLLESSCAGYWSPETRDSGTAEGIYIQLKKPVSVDFIDIHMKPNIDPLKTNLNCFLDGKEESNEQTWFGVSLKSSNADEVVYRVQSLTVRPYGSPKGKDVPLNAFIRTMFIKLTRIGYKAGADHKPCITKIALVERGRPVTLQEIKTIEATVHASTTLRPQTAYQAANLFDSKYDFAWSTDGKKNDGIGETLLISFQEKLDLSGLMIWNGYQRSSVHYASNGRVARLCVESDGSQPQTIKIKDVNGEQIVRFEETLIGVRKLKIRILDVYRGSRYKDVLLSELRFLDAEARIVNLRVEKERPLPSLLLNKLTDISLGSFGGHATNNEDGSIGYVDRTIRFRSNGTFVIYDLQDRWNDDEDNDKPDYIYEGNWENAEQGIRIFGKKYSPSYGASQYLTGQEGSSYGIFQSNVSIKQYVDITDTQRIAILRQMIKQDLGSETNMLKPMKWPTCLEDKVTSRSQISGRNLDDLLKKIDAYMMKKNVYYFSSDVLKTLVFPFDENKVEGRRW